ncbi:MAG: amidohydrolase family protein, partial [Aggregatilineales bacterium]
TIYFSMDEDNIRKKIQLPFVSFCSDAGSFAPEPPFISRHTHPRAYGSFARVLGRYCRDEKLLSLEEAVRRMSALPAENLKIDHERGLLQSGYFADIVIFDAANIKDNATFVNPHQYATGMQHVFVNGEQVLRYGNHTGAKPGHFVHGPGYSGGY